MHESALASERLDESEQRFRELFDRSPAGIALITDDGRFREVNDALCDFLGLTRREVFESSYDAVVHPEERQAARLARELYRNGASRTFRNERRFTRPDGTLVGAHPRHPRGRRRSADQPGVLRGRHRQKEVEDRLRHAATHDSLTGLPNRRRLIDALDDALARRRRSLRPLAVLFVDLDRVKQVNDLLGHEAGDELLVRISRRLEATMRATDTVARVGGDEFVIVCPDLDSESEVPGVARA